MYSLDPAGATVRATTRVGGKRARIVHAIEASIRAGELNSGEQLESEHALAQRFSVSRGTVRQALEDLKERNLISTVGGVGSFVTYDGVALDQSVGWAESLRLAGGEIATAILSIRCIEWSKVGAVDPSDANGSGADRAVEIRRVRTIADGESVSYETSVIPAVGRLSDVPSTGLVDDSIWATLASAGLRAVKGTQEVRVEVLGDDAALALDRRAGETFLRTDRWSYSRDGRLVEYVSALLDPAHFRLTTTFGADS